MKLLSRYLSLVAVATFLICSPALWAAECCDKTTELVKKGEACAKCVEHPCCKATAEKIAKEEGIKTCSKCDKAADEKKDDAKKDDEKKDDVKKNAEKKKGKGKKGKGEEDKK